MCYIAIIKQIGEPNPQTEERIRKILQEKADYNSDGFFFRLADFELRTTDDRKAVEKIKQLPLDNLMAHFRIASAGVVSEDNVHGWKIGDWQFFHNGSVSDYIKTYAQAKEQSESDSLLFFQDLALFLQEITTKKSKKFDRQVENIIRNIATETFFWGRAALYYEPLDKMFLFGDFNIYTFDSSYLIISSSKLNLDQTTNVHVHGFNVKYSQDSLIGEQTSDGIGVINSFSTNGFEYKYLGELKDFKNSHVANRPALPARTTPNYQADDDLGFPSAWEETENGIYAPKVQTPEITTMKENIEKVACELDIEIKSPKVEVEEIDDWSDLDATSVDLKILWAVQREIGFIGRDKKTGEELYLDEDGIHDIVNKCCEGQTCRDPFNLEGIEFVDYEKELALYGD